MSEKTPQDGNNNQRWPQYLAAFTAVIATFSAGIHYGWPTPSLPKLLSPDHPLNLTSVQVSYVVAVASFGDVVGNVASTVLADAIGRKPTILLIAVPQALSALLFHLSSDSLLVLHVARFSGGVGEGACLCVIAIYIGEISEPTIRGILISFFSISWCSGCLFINIVGSYSTIESAGLVALAFPVIFLVTFIFAPESPYYLLMVKRVKEAREALKTFRWNDDVDEELCELHRGVRRQMSERGRYGDLFLIRSNRSALLIMMTVVAISEFSGISSLTFYAQIFFTRTTSVLPEHWAASLIIFLQLVFSTVSLFTVDLMGRRPLLLFSIAGCASILTLLCVYFLLEDSLSASPFNFIPLASMIVFVMFFNLGVANIVNCLNGELFSASIKTKAACVSAIWYSVCVVAVTKIYQTLSDGYGLGAPLGVFALMQVVGWLFCWRFVPETKGKTLEEIQQEIKGGETLEACRQPLLPSE